MKNPYSELVNHMRTQGAKYNTPYVQIGVVTTADPLSIKLGDLQIGADNLLVADYLMPSYQRKVSMPITEGGGTMSEVVVGDHGSHTHVITELSINDGAVTFTDGLKKDDLIALIPTLDEQTYIVLSKVVKP